MIPDDNLEPRTQIEFDFEERLNFEFCLQLASSSTEGRLLDPSKNDSFHAHS